MGSIHENEPDSTVYESRVSYFMLLEEKQRALNKKALLHRLVYIAKLSPELLDKRDLGYYYEELFKELQNTHQAEGVSGILLIYPGYAVHFIESSSDMIYSILRDMDKLVSQGNTLITDPKILTLSHDVPTRLYQAWSYRVLNITSGREEYEGKEGVDELAVEAVTSLLKLGMFILKSPKLNVTSAMDTLRETVPDLLIPQDQLAFLIKRPELDSPAAFLKLFDQPVDIALDNELMWPLEENIAVN
uniref:Inner-arm dynein f/I1 light chain with BLUF domain n=1 Tax=Ciona intestinalis TaxID=7719 RepID=A0A6F8PDS8_CIOIN|nr:inner-arm dynein f/I1 light chain with BLUF domain [Ciona intestinalis]